MTAYQRPVDAAALAQNFRVFANADCASEPLYAALSRAIAGDHDILELLLQAPYPQRRPVLLFAATHDLLLAGAAHPLARFYRSVAPASDVRLDVDHAFAAFADFCVQQRDALVVSLRERTTQTNEVGRCAGLRLMLAGLEREQPLALIDVGCSAGLNLLVDRYRFDYRVPDRSARRIGPDSAVVIPAAFEGDVSVLDGTEMPAIVERFGIDLEPLDVRDPRDARWLRACVWPSEVERHVRLAGAIALARGMSENSARSMSENSARSMSENPARSMSANPARSIGANRPPGSMRHATRDVGLDLRRGDAIDLLPGIVAAIARDVRPVVFHSWVVSYFDREARTRFAEAARAIVLERDGVWISAEATAVVPGLDAPALAADALPERREATLWHVTTRNADGASKVRAMARSHPHCRWIEWLALER